MMMNRVGAALSMALILVALGGCEASEGSTDGGPLTPDAGEPPPPADAGAVQDAGTIQPDAGMSVPEAGMSVPDAGAEPFDGGAEDGGAGCPPIPAVFDPIFHFHYEDPYEESPYYNRPGTGGWGRAPHQGTLVRNWWHDATRDPETSMIHKMTLRYWTFVASDNVKVWIKLNNFGFPVSAISISECPGQFDTEDPSCGRPHSIEWATGDQVRAGACNLEAGKTYYLNQAVFNMTEFRGTGHYTSSIDCDRETCITPYTAQPI